MFAAYRPVIYSLCMTEQDQVPPIAVADFKRAVAQQMRVLHEFVQQFRISPFEWSAIGLRQTIAAKANDRRLRAVLQYLWPRQRNSVAAFTFYEKDIRARHRRHPAGLTQYAAQLIEHMVKRNQVFGIVGGIGEG